MGQVTLFLLVAFLVLCRAHLESEESNVRIKLEEASTTGPAMDRLFALKKIYDMGFIKEDEFQARKTKLVDEITGVKYQAPTPVGSGTIYSPQLQFLLNRFIQGLPRSYSDVLPSGANFWTTSMYLDVGAIDPYGNQVPLDSEIAIQERTLTRYGLNLYDGATWEIALALEGLGHVALIYEENILYPASTGANTNVGGIVDIRSDTSDYNYGTSGIQGNNLQLVALPGNTTRVIAVNGNPTTQTTKTIPGAYFYRMIGPKYFMTDPFDGDYGNSWKYPYPNNDTTTPWNIAGLVHWNDWKPITGENVWAAITGPVQVLWITNGTKMAPFTTFANTPAPIQLAISILPAMKALQSPLGSLYHCPKGTKMFPPDPNEQSNVSNENNFSAYAALTMLYEVLKNKTVGTTDPVLTQAITNIESLRTGLESWFSKYLLSETYRGYNVVYQGGHISFAGDYAPVLLNETGGFAVDCQTWGMTVLGQKNVDAWYGNETAYNIWQATKKFAGYYNPQGQLGGVGYTIVQNNGSSLIWSAEWTWGAIGACEKLAYEYNLTGRADLAESLMADANSMASLVTQPLVRCANGAWCGGGLVQEDGSYLYANSRFFIPWGWYANPIGATCSTAWSIMNKHKFNPFILGGGFVSPLSLED